MLKQIINGELHHDSFSCHKRNLDTILDFSSFLLFTNNWPSSLIKPFLSILISTASSQIIRLPCPASPCPNVFPLLPPYHAFSATNVMLSLPALTPVSPAASGKKSRQLITWFQHTCLSSLISGSSPYPNPFLSFL